MVGVELAEDAADLGAEDALRAGPAAGSTSTTSAPICRAEAATSEPIQPAPITATRSAGADGVASRSASARVRRWWTPSRSAPGTSRRRGAAPVASSSGVVADPLAAVEDDLRAPSGRCAVDRAAGAQLDVVLGVEALVVDAPVALGVAAQDALDSGGRS